MNFCLLAVLASSAAAFAPVGPAATSCALSVSTLRKGEGLASDLPKVISDAALTPAQVDFFSINETAVTDPPSAAPLATELLEVITGNKECVDLVSLIEACEGAYSPGSFQEEKILGDWRLKYQLDSKRATRSQKALAGYPADSNFITDERGRKIFRNVARLSKKRVAVVADVAYEVWGANRLASDIVAAGLTVRVGARFGWRPLRIPLPLRGNGWLDVTYLDDRMRITRGNRGGLFVHVRPELA